ncbi:MAG: hypothetical protein QOI27_348 [Gaiellaceae bacterium]|jgi:hypothetical protein|nr:hypothetical protein [Gaiellaceae bacterium]MDX6468490.1 hypothetical protein [Gaiellaceae bacterium]MDX6473834.1 hypothetical protein [Gaiellaceae bacterium]
MKTIMDPAVAFSVPPHEEPVVEVRVNFGVYAGRNATPAEIDDLAHLLRDEATQFTITVEERHEFGNDRETSLRQVVVEVDRQSAGDDPGALTERIVAKANEWASACIASRSDLGDLGLNF